MKKKYTYPFTAIVGQEEMKLALILNIINPAISGVLIRGEKGTAKSTAVRALADILPEIGVIGGIPFNLSPGEDPETVRECFAVTGQAMPAADALPVELRKVKVVELPVGATEDRVVGTLDLEHALKAGEKRIEPGLLSGAHRGILYVDEVNLLDDHVVDVLLDSAAMGVNTIEREGVSFSHPARFTLVGTMNPEEGELRPQLLDRFGLCVHVGGITDPRDRVTVMERRFAFEEDPERFFAEWQEASQQLAERIVRARDLCPSVSISREHLLGIAKSCLNAGVDGHRGDIIIMKTAKTIAAWDGRDSVGAGDIDRAVAFALPHRVRRQPLQDMVMDVGSLPGVRQTAP